MIAVREGMVIEEVEIPDLACETVWAKVTLKNCNPLFLGCFYRPPKDNSTAPINELDKALTHVSQLTRNNPRATVILAGDFNVGDIDWEANRVKDGSSKRVLCQRVIDLLGTHDLQQFQTEPTREDKILDLFCINKPSLVKAMHTIPGFSDHHAIIADCDVRLNISKKPPRKILQWSKAQWDTLREECVSFRDSFLTRYRGRSVNDNYNEFQKHIEGLISKHVPFKWSKTRYDVPWLTIGTKRLCRKKQRFFYRAKRTHKKTALGSVQSCQKRHTENAMESKMGLYQQCASART